MRFKIWGHAAKYSAIMGKWLCIASLCALASACSTSKSLNDGKKRSKEFFAESVYGVKASPRLVESGPVPKGGGRYMVGKPYQVRGKTFVPKENPNYDAVGIASWYGDAFHGRLTANGELYDKQHLSAAHPTLPLPSYARVTNLDSGSSVIVRINDRGPFHKGRIIDLSNKTAQMLDMAHSGTGKVRVQYIGPARMDGHDMPYLMASYVRKGERGPFVDPQMQISPDVMVASNDQNSLPSVNLPQQGEIPVPSLALAMNGSTPSGAAAPDNILAAPQAGSVGQAYAGDMISDAVSLPQIGPVPALRPNLWGVESNMGSASAYAPDESRGTALAFDAILVRNGNLTEASILSSVARGGIQLSHKP